MWQSQEEIRAYQKLELLFLRLLIEPSNRKQLNISTANVSALEIFYNMREMETHYCREEGTEVDLESFFRM